MKTPATLRSFSLRHFFHRTEDVYRMRAALIRLLLPLILLSVICVAKGLNDHGETDADTYLQTSSDVVQYTFDTQPDGAKVAFLSLIGLWLHGPLVGAISGTAFAIILKLQNNTEDGSFDQNAAGKIGKVLQHKCTDDELFGSMISGFLFGYSMQHSMFSAIASSMIASYIATKSGIESQFVCLVGNITMEGVKEIVVIGKQYNMTEKLESMVGKLTTYMWELDEEYHVSDRLRMEASKKIGVVNKQYNTTEKLKSIVGMLTTYIWKLTKSIMSQID